MVFFGLDVECFCFEFERVVLEGLFGYFDFFELDDVV